MAGAFYGVNMVCLLLVVAFILLLVSLWLERSWLTVFVVFFFLAFFAILLLGSIANLAPAESVIDLNSYRVCYKKMVNLETYRQYVDKIGNYSEQILNKFKTNEK